MLPKRKVVYLSRFFEENVEQVASMCVKCYQQEDEVKVIGINRKFSNAIKARRLESLQKKQKLNEDDNFTGSTSSEEISSNVIKQKSHENSSNITDSEEPSSDLHDSSSSVDTEFESSSNLTSTSNISLQDNRSNFDEDTNTDSQITSIENGNSCHFNDDEEKFDQIYTNILSYNKDEIVECNNTSKILEDISIDTNNKMSFKNILRKSNNVLQNTLQNSYNDVDQTENIIPNNTCSSVIQTSSEINLNNILNKIKCKRQYEDSSSDYSEEDYDFFENNEAKTENISTEKITGTVISQSIFKTLNSKNSRLYDDYSTNVNSSKKYKHQSISSVKYNVNTVQSAGSAALNNKDITSLNNDKHCNSSKKYEEMLETTKDDSIIELINRIHSPVEFLTETSKTNIVKEERLIEEKQNDSVADFNNRIQSPIISKDKQSLEETNRTEGNIIEETNIIEENIIEENGLKETCSQYFSQNPESISDTVQKYFECSVKETESKVNSYFVTSITSNFSPKEKNTKRKINFSNLRKKT